MGLESFWRAKKAMVTLGQSLMLYRTNFADGEMFSNGLDLAAGEVTSKCGPEEEVASIWVEENYTANLWLMLICPHDRYTYLQYNEIP